MGSETAQCATCSGDKKKKEDPKYHLAGASASVGGGALGVTGSVGVVSDGSWSGTHGTFTGGLTTSLAPNAGANADLVFAKEGLTATDVVGGASSEANVGILHGATNDSGFTRGLSTPGLSGTISTTQVSNDFWGDVGKLFVTPAY